jgi:DNA-binding transcriptional regulator YdaS (Cro superfamily)
MKLIEYITANYGGSQVKFASAHGVKPQQVTQWINKKFIVVSGVLYSPRRELDT